MFKFFIENDMSSPNQSGFKPEDYCINQVRAITHDIYKSMDLKLYLIKFSMDV